MSLNKRADYDLQVAKDYISSDKNPTNDEYFYDIAAYHAQQAIEKKLKYALIELFDEDETSRKFKTHSIDYLIYKAEEKGLAIDNELKEMAVTITDWEANSRYGTNIVVTQADIRRSIELCESLSQQIQDAMKSHNIRNSEDDD